MLSRLYRRPYFLLTLTPLFWAGNTIAGRLALGEVQPFTLVFLRFLFASAAAAIFWRREIWAAFWPHRARWRWFLFMGLCGHGGFTLLLYVALHRTAAINIGIIQGAIPILVLLGAFAVYRSPPRGRQLVGAFVTVIGVIIVVIRGEWQNLTALRFHFGDLLMLLACLGYAAYTVGLKNRPPINGAVFFSLLAMIAWLFSLPFAAAEVLSPDYRPPTARGWLIILYVAVFPAFAQVLFIRGVELIGPTRAGVFVNLVPVFSVLLAVAILSETFHWFQIAALGLVLLGIFLCEYRGRQRRTAD